LLARAGTGGADPVVPGGGGASGDGPGTFVGRIVSVLSPALAVVSRFTQPLRLLTGELVAGIDVLFTRPGALYHTFIRSGDAAAALDSSGRESVNLTILESAPVLAAVVGGVPALWRRRDSISLPERVLAARTVVDVFAVILVLATTFQYASRLPVHAQLTVRYLLVLYPLGIYLLVRLPVVRRTLDDNWRVFVWTTASTVLIGGQLFAVGVFWTAIGIGAAVQLHGVVGLGAALPLSLWALVGRSEGSFGVSGAMLLGLTTGLSLIFTILVTIEYSPIGNTHLIPVIKIVSEIIPLI
jgi:hypothetical protein